jgi:hypothetical protein
VSLATNLYFCNLWGQKNLQKFLSVERFRMKQGAVTCACNSSDSEGGDLGSYSSKSIWAKKLARSHLNKQAGGVGVRLSYRGDMGRRIIARLVLGKKQDSI